MSFLVPHLSVIPSPIPMILFLSMRYSNLSTSPLPKMIGAATTNLNFDGVSPSIKLYQFHNLLTNCPTAQVCSQGRAVYFIPIKCPIEMFCPVQQVNLYHEGSISSYGLSTSMHITHHELL